MAGAVLFFFFVLVFVEFQLDALPPSLSRALSLYRVDSNESSRGALEYLRITPFSSCSYRKTRLYSFNTFFSPLILAFSSPSHGVICFIDSSLLRSNEEGWDVGEEKCSFSDATIVTCRLVFIVVAMEKEKTTKKEFHRSSFSH